jgi:hypothetical protein
MKQQLEYQLQKQICQYLELQYPEVLFLSDTIASVRLTIPQQLRNKAIQKKNFACPDLLILEPRKAFNGLFIELKTKTPFKKNGELLKSDHLKRQAKTIEELNKKGYLSQFSWGFEMTKELIDNYLK